jgi:hypothetical protein
LQQVPHVKQTEAINKLALAIFATQQPMLSAAYSQTMMLMHESFCFQLNSNVLPIVIMLMVSVSASHHCFILGTALHGQVPCTGRQGVSHEGCYYM